MADRDTIVIRPLAEGDAAAFKALRLQAIQDAPSAVQPTHEEEAAHTLEDMRRRIRATGHEVVFGAFLGDALVGVTGLRRFRAGAGRAQGGAVGRVRRSRTPARRCGAPAAGRGHRACPFSAGAADPAVREYGEPACPGAVPQCRLRGIRCGAARAVRGRPFYDEAHMVLRLDVGDGAVVSVG